MTQPGGAGLERLRAIGVPVDALHPQLVEQLQTLDDTELQFLGSIKTKLNSGLDDQLRQAADTVGGFVW